LLFSARKPFATAWNVAVDLNDVVCTSCYDHCVAVTSDGRIVAWGSNEFGQCEVPNDIRAKQVIILM
jgi:alpha-tubulin suppressor-like RCC1 family protein